MSEDARVLLREIALADQRAGVRGAVACARWALERYWTDASDRRPWVAIETAEAWLRGEATEEECKRAAYAARLAAEDDAASWAAADAALAASWATVTAARAAHAAACAADNAPAAADHAAYATAWRAFDVAKAAAYAASHASDVAKAAAAYVAALRELCDVIRAAVEP